MNAVEKKQCGYTVIAGGNQQWLRCVSIPLIESLEHSLEDDSSVQFTDRLPDNLEVDSRPRADATILIGGMVGVFAFFGSWLASKILDDIYEAKFQPAIKRALGSADSSLSGSNATKPKILEIGVYYEDKGAFILVAIIGSTFDEILTFGHIVAPVHQRAVEWINTNETREAVHLYVVNRGNVNLEPKVFENLTLAHNHLHSVELR